MISVVLLVKNEEEMIAGALQSVGWADEIIVGIDTTSTDDTDKIARKFNTKIIRVDTSKGFATAKNKIIDAAKNEWVFLLDADERVTKELSNEIKYITISTNFSAYSIPRKNIQLGRVMMGGGWQSSYDTHIRLFKKNKARYGKKEIHETLEINGEIGNLDGKIEHYTHRTISEVLRKIDQYSKYEADIIAKTLPYPTKRRDILKPALVHFYWRYLTQKGYRDGIEGLIEAVNMSFYIFVNYSKAWELLKDRNKKNKRNNNYE